MKETSSLNKMSNLKINIHFHFFQARVIFSGASHKLKALLMTTSQKVTEIVVTKNSNKTVKNENFYQQNSLCLFFPADIISCVEFNQDGDLLATGDKGGRVVIFQRDPAVS